MELRNGFKKKWWHDAIFYEIYIRSFADSNGDGIGDINGIISKLDYLKDLGVDAIWITPFYPSPMFDCGYDISDYKSIAPEYGTLEDFDRLIKEAHDRGIKVVLDMVLNHTSDQHYWFQEAKKSKDSKYRNYYIWAEGKEGKAPNNWYSIFGGSSWEYNEATGDYYYHAFFPQQPDLNWRNEELKKEMFDVIRFWLDRGVDGFRLDAINFLLEDAQLRDNPGEGQEQEHIYDRDQDDTHDVLKELRAVLDEYEDKVLIGEVFPGTPGQSQKYYGSGNDELHLAFNFLMLKLASYHLDFNAATLRKETQLWDEATKEVGWPVAVMGNHDQPRAYSSFGEYISEPYREKLAKGIAVYLLTSKGTPFLYYGEEIGMENYLFMDPEEFRDNSGKWLYNYLTKEKGVPHEEAILKANDWGRDKCRTPMQWSKEKNAGFTTADKAWTLINPQYKEKNVEDQLKDENSFLNFYKKLIRLRKEKEPLMAGDYIWIDNDSRDYMGYIRKSSKGEVLVLINFTNKEIRLDENMFINKREKINLLLSNYSDSTFTKDFILKPAEALLAEFV